METDTSSGHATENEEYAYKHAVELGANDGLIRTMQESITHLTVYILSEQLGL